MSITVVSTPLGENRERKVGTAFLQPSELLLIVELLRKDGADELATMLEALLYV